MFTPVFNHRFIRFVAISLFAIVLLTSDNLSGQKVTVFPEYKYGLQSIVEFTDNGCLMEKAQPKYNKENILEDYDYYLLNLDTGFKQINIFMSRNTDLKKLKYVNRFVLKDKIVVIYLKVLNKPNRFQLLGYSIDKKSLQLDPTPKLLVEREGTINLKKGCSYFEREGYYGLSFSYTIVKGTQNSMAEISVFNEQLSLTHSFPTCLFLQEDLGTLLLPEKDYRIIRERNVNGNQFMKLPSEKYSVQPLLKDEFVFLDAEGNLVIWMPVWSNSGKNDHDIFSHIIFKTIKKDQTILTKCLNISSFELHDLSLIYNTVKNEVFLTGPYKGEAFGKFTAFSSVVYSFPELKEKVKSTHLFTPELSKAIHTFYNKPDMGEPGIPFDVDLITPVVGPDGSYYSFYRYYTSEKLLEGRQRNQSLQEVRWNQTTGSGMHTAMSTNSTGWHRQGFRQWHEIRNDYGPIVITAVDSSLGLKWVNVIPQWIQGTNDHVFAGFTPVPTSKGLAMIYNEERDNLQNSLTINSPKEKPDRLTSGVPVEVFIDHSGKMIRKPLLEEKKDDRRMFDIMNAFAGNNQKITFVLRPYLTAVSYRFNLVEVDYSKE